MGGNGVVYIAIHGAGLDSVCIRGWEGGGEGGLGGSEGVRRFGWWMCNVRMGTG